MYRNSSMLPPLNMNTLEDIYTPFVAQRYKNFLLLSLKSTRSFVSIIDSKYSREQFRIIATIYSSFSSLSPPPIPEGYTSSTQEAISASH